MMARIGVLFLLLGIGVMTCAADIPEALLVKQIRYIPLRPVAVWLGAKTDVKSTGVITLTVPGKILCLAQNYTSVTLNGSLLQPSPTVISRNSQTFLPESLFKQVFGVDTVLDPATQRITLRATGVGQPITFQLVMVNSVDSSEMNWIPAGEFVMGADAINYLLPMSDHAQRYTVNEPGTACESPAHQVNLNGFWMGRNEISVALYRRFCQATKLKIPTISADRDAYPISGVSWSEAAAYAKWAGGRLPTEAEWEKAARGMDSRVYPWGDRWDAGRFEGLKRSPADGLFRIGSFPAGASPYGINDLIGNVKEWCVDWYDADYYRFSPYLNPTGPKNGEERVVRGSSWSGDQTQFLMTCRCIQRDSRIPTMRATDIGFRVVIPEPSSIDTKVDRQAVPVGRVMDADALYTREFPEGYRCTGAWHADFNGDGQEDIVAIAVSTSENPQPPLMKIFQCHEAAVYTADEYLFNDQEDGVIKWCRPSGDAPLGDPLPPYVFGVRDLNADGKLEIFLILRSAKPHRYDEVMCLFQWGGKGQLKHLSQIPFHDAEKGVWLIDQLSHDHMGMEIVTVGHRLDDDAPVAFLPQKYAFTYYGWTGSIYAEYRSKVTEWKYEDGLGAISDPEW